MGEKRRPFWFLGRRAEAIARDVDDELAAHLEMRVAELRAAGLSEDDARREARRRFGDIDGTREYCRRQDLEKEQRVGRALDLADLAGDVKISIRGLVRAKGLAAVVVATVGLGIGATTVAFSAVHVALLRPLPYPDPGRLVRIFTDSPPNRFRLSVVDYRAVAERQTQFERVAGYTERPMAWTDGTTAERLRGRVVTWTYFDVLGIRPALGRGFLAEEGRPGGAAAVVVSDGFWKRRLGGRADALGRPVRLDGADHLLVGVLPPDPGPLEQGLELFVPAQWDAPPRRGPFFVLALGRLRGSAEAAGAELRAINREIFPLWRGSYQDERATWSLMSLEEHIVGDAGRPATVGAGRGGPGVADRVRERVEPARGPDEQPRPRAGRAGGPRRVALAGVAPPSRRERVAGLRVRRPRRGAGRRRHPAPLHRGRPIRAAGARGGPRRPRAGGAPRPHPGQRDPVRPRARPARVGRPGERDAPLDRPLADG